MDYPGIPEMTVLQLKSLMDADERPFILDVRSPREYGIANLEGTLIPLRDLVDRTDELAAYRDKLVVVHCRSGARSAHAVQLLTALGFRDARNLRGGTLAWSREIDPSMPEY